jgi:hypothetical protein
MSWGVWALGLLFAPWLFLQPDCFWGSLAFLPKSQFPQMVAFSSTHLNVLWGWAGLLAVIMWTDVNPAKKNLLEKTSIPVSTGDKWWDMEQSYHQVSQNAILIFESLHPVHKLSCYLIALWRTVYSPNLHFFIVNLCSAFKSQTWLEAIPTPSLLHLDWWTLHHTISLKTPSLMIMLPLWPP